MLMPFELSMEELRIALSLLGDALPTNDPTKINRACSEGWWTYRNMADLYPKLQLDPTQRESLLRQLFFLKSRLEECDEEAKRFSGVYGQ